MDCAFAGCALLSHPFMEECAARTGSGETQQVQDFGVGPAAQPAKSTATHVTNPPGSALPPASVYKQDPVEALRDVVGGIHDGVEAVRAGQRTVRILPLTPIRLIRPLHLRLLPGDRLRRPERARSAACSDRPAVGCRTRRRSA